MKRLILCIAALVSMARPGFSQTISTVAGNGTEGYSGDGGPATEASLSEPISVSLDGQGNIYISDRGNNRIRKVDAATGLITTVAGTGEAGYSGDGGPATQAKLRQPWGIHVNESGDLFIADYLRNRVRKVDGETGTIITIAGTGTRGYSGDGGPAIEAQLRSPTDVWVSDSGDIYIADAGNGVIRRVDISGVITTFAGICGYFICIDAAGNGYTATRQEVHMIDADNGTISVVAGDLSRYAYNQDGIPAVQASIYPGGVCVDHGGNIYFTEGGSRVRKVDAQSGRISTVAGNRISGYGGDGGNAFDASLSGAAGIALDAEGNLYIADRYNHRIRKVVLSSSVSRPGIWVPETRISFPTTRVDTFSTRSLTISNVGTEELSINDIRADEKDFSVSPASATIPVGAEPVSFSINFAPASEGPRPAQLIISHNADDGDPVYVRLEGTGTPIILWDAELNFPIWPDVSIQMRFGLAEKGTDGIDTILDEVAIPPPLIGVPDVRFLLPDNSGTYISYLSSGRKTATWTLQVLPGENGYPLFVTWDPSQLPEEGSFRFQDVIPGLDLLDVDMRTQNQVEISGPALQHTQIVYRTRAAFSVELPAGWNMVSLPLTPDENGLKALFPDAISAHKFEGRYGQVTKLEPGQGYWVNLAQGGAYTVHGMPEPTCEHRLPAGWRLIGVPWGGTQVSGIIQNPSESLRSVFEFSGHYAEAASLVPGRGYMVHMGEPGSLTLYGAAGAAKAAVPSVPASAPSAERILWAESGPYRQEIRLGADTDAVRPLPPVPPAGLFDVRVEVADVGSWQVPRTPETGEYAVRVQGRDVIFGWDLEAAGEGVWQLVVNDEVYDLTGIGSVAADPSDRVFVRRQGPAVPQEYKLEQNVPNPFNPETQIHYQLPEAGAVSLVVFNALGQQVRVLVSERQEPGGYRVTWDGKDEAGRPVASGMYVYRLISGRFEQSRQMLFLK